MRVFCQAQKFAGVNIDENLVCESVSWLIRNQRGDGALPEVHAVIHKEMVVRNKTQNLIFFTSNSFEWTYREFKLDVLWQNSKR